MSGHLKGFVCIWRHITLHLIVEQRIGLGHMGTIHLPLEQERVEPPKNIKAPDQAADGRSISLRGRFVLTYATIVLIPACLARKCLFTLWPSIQSLGYNIIIMGLRMHNMHE